MSLNDSIFQTLRGSYLTAVRDMALYPDNHPAHHDAERMAASASNTAFAVLGHGAAEALRKEGLQEWERIRGYALA